MSTDWSKQDIAGMRAALAEAKLAADSDEIPVGAVVIANGEIIARGHNRSITDNDPSAHAEIIALRAAALAQSNYRLSGATLYVTLEPCVMCVGAIVQARVGRVIFGAYDDKAGALVQPADGRGRLTDETFQRMVRVRLRSRRGPGGANTDLHTVFGV